MPFLEKIQSKKQTNAKTFKFYALSWHHNVRRTIQIRIVRYLFRTAIRHKDFPRGVHVENLKIIIIISCSPQSETNHHRRALPLSCGHFKTLRKPQKATKPARNLHNGFGVQTCTFQPNITSQHIRALVGLQNSTAGLGKFTRLFTLLKIKHVASSMVISKPSHAAWVPEGNHRPTGSWRDTLQCRALIKQLLRILISIRDTEKF